LGALLFGCRRLRIGRIDAGGSSAQVGDAPPGAEAGDEPLLLLREPAWRDLGEVVMEQARVGQREDRRGGDVRKARGDDDSVEDARIIVGGLVALIGPSGT